MEHLDVERTLERYKTRQERRETTITLIVCLFCGAILNGLGGFASTMVGLRFRNELLQNGLPPVIRESLAIWTLIGAILGLLIGVHYVRLYVRFSVSAFLLFYEIPLLCACGLLAGGALGFLVYASPQLGDAFAVHSTLAKMAICGAASLLATVLTAAVGRWVPGKASAWKVRHVKRLIEGAKKR
jgi:hypothetical protein